MRNRNKLAKNAFFFLSPFSFFATTMYVGLLYKSSSTYWSHFCLTKNRCYSIRQKVCEIPGRKRMSSFNQLSEKLTAGVSACAIFKSNREKKRDSRHPPFVRSMYKSDDDVIYVHTYKLGRSFFHKSIVLQEK